MRTRGLFVTSSGTGVGKTFVMQTLITALRRKGRPVEALKPIISGFDPEDLETSDTGQILAALGRAPSPEHVARVSPWRFGPPLSPDMAAGREGRKIDLDGVVAHCRRVESEGDAVLLVEGIGGVMVPLNEGHTVLDWITALELPTLLVVGSYLGTLSHTLTAASVLLDRAVEFQVVVSESVESPVPLEETRACLERHLPGTDVTCLLRGTPEDPQGAALVERLGL